MTEGSGRSYRYLTADVFTSSRFGGNPLAVLPDAEGLTSEEMLAITREFNYSETAFVFPPDDPANTRRVRIFTPGGELPFAGHPTVGTAFVLAATGEIELPQAETRIVLEEGVGPVPVLIRGEGGRPVFSQLTSPRLPEVVAPLPPVEDLAAMLSLAPDDFAGGDYPPEGVSCGNPFAFVPLRDRGAVARARLRLEVWEEVLASHPAHMVMVFTHGAEEPGHDLRARMFGPGVGVPEDPATGSACVALGGYLGSRDPARDGTLRWVVEQGYEMGRPSVLEVECDKSGGAITAVRVGGASVMVCEGTIRV